MISFVYVKAAFLVGFIIGLLFAIFLLHYHYKISFKKYTNEIYNQYQNILKQKGYNTKIDVGL